MVDLLMFFGTLNVHLSRGKDADVLAVTSELTDSAVGAPFTHPPLAVVARRPGPPPVVGAIYPVAYRQSADDALGRMRVIGAIGFTWSTFLPMAGGGQGER